MAAGLSLLDPKSDSKVLFYPANAGKRANPFVLFRCPLAITYVCNFLLFSNAAGKRQVRLDSLTCCYFLLPLWFKILPVIDESFVKISVIRGDLIAPHQT